MRVLMVVLVASAAVLVAGCGLFGTGGGSDVAEHFEDPETRELAAAVSAGAESRIRDLVEGGVSVDAAGKDGVTMLQWAVFEHEPRSLETLLTLGADVEQPGLGGSTVLHSAAIGRSPRHLEILLAAGADPDVRHARTGRTPLMGAVGMRTDEHFSMLLEAGADVTLADNMGLTALHLAAMVNAHTHVLELLERGADPEAESVVGATFQDFFWRTPVDVLNEEALEGRRLVAEWLEAHGVEVAEEARWTKDER